jgi:gliding motility-associated protein GldM
MVPTVAALTILSKFQNDVRTSENRIVQFCHNKVGEVVFRQDAFAALAVADANYVMPGQEINVTAGVGGFSKAVQPIISINGTNVPIDADGTAKMKITGGGLGQHSIPVHIVYTDQDGKKVAIDKNVDYTVGQSASSIGLDKMNVLYIGVDNPVTISSTAGGSEKLQVSINNGTITSTGGGHYIAKVNTVSDDCKINVSVDGKPAGAQVFRVRTIPTAVATVGGVQSGENMTVGQFKAQAGVGAWIKDFPFELKYTVVSFTFTCDDGEGGINEAPCTGNLWSNQALGYIRNLAPNRTVTIDNIRALAPDGHTQHLPSLIYYIK